MLEDYVNNKGKLLICEYGSSKDNEPKEWINEELENYGFTVSNYRSGYWNGKELTRVAVVLKEEN